MAGRREYPWFRAFLTPTDYTSSIPVAVAVNGLAFLVREGADVLQRHLTPSGTDAWALAHFFLHATDALDTMAMARRNTVFDLLTDLGADWSMPTGQGLTPLQLALNNPDALSRHMLSHLMQAAPEDLMREGGGQMSPLAFLRAFVGTVNSTRGSGLQQHGQALLADAEAFAASVRSAQDLQGAMTDASGMGRTTRARM